MTHEYNTERIFEGKLKKKKDVVSVGGEYPISHLERELEKTLEKYPDSYARISIFIGSISKSILIKAKKKETIIPN